jgi:RHS repeat-associated protein
MSRRVGKQHLKRVKGNENQSSPSQTSLQIQSSLWFGWDGDRMVTMQNDRQASTTIYEPGSFVPMLRVDKQLQADDRRAKGELRTYHVHCNHLGTPEALIETDSLQLVWQIELDPWGQTQREYNPNNMLQPIRMQGQQLDSETGLFYNRYRYYDPAGGRYVTQDPIGLQGGLNLYGYVGGEPLSVTDPMGLQATVLTRTGPISGNWGGKDWSGGLRPSQNGGEMGTAPPLNSVDACAKEHDTCWYKAEGSNRMCVPSAVTKSSKDICDASFSACLRELHPNPKNWPLPPQPGTAGDVTRFRNGGEFLGDHNFFRK